MKDDGVNSSQAGSCGAQAGVTDHKRRLLKIQTNVKRNYNKPCYMYICKQFRPAIYI